MGAALPARRDSFDSDTDAWYSRSMCGGRIDISVVSMAIRIGAGGGRRRCGAGGAARTPDRIHPRFPRRVNAGFMQIVDRPHPAAVYERGTGETLACGTGACAAVVADPPRPSDSPVRVTTLGGDLSIAWNGAAADTAAQSYAPAGHDDRPASTVFSAEIQLPKT